MLSTKLTTTDNGILSHKFIPENIRALIERRTANNKRFGKLEISTPQIDDTADTADPRNIIAGFLLDTSGSMDGSKIRHAINTIQKFVEVLHSERNGKTIPTQKIRAWIYLITFNSYADLIIPFQEITDETLPIINEHLDLIRTNGSTNYERAFQKQAEVIEDIIKKLNDPLDMSVEGGRNPHESVEGGRNPQRNPQHYHVIRFFETDGEITEGSRNIKRLYEMMRSTSTAAATETEEAAGAATATRITFEDYILGYGTDVDLRCLKQLASPYAPETATTSTTATSTTAAATTSTTATTAAAATTTAAATTSTTAAATTSTTTTDQKANVVPVVGGRNPPRTSHPNTRPHIYTIRNTATNPP